ncbi:WD40 repeat-like protein [Penicillium verhagenii]|uniref:WD40 repeat-like protein n=1 Tax=Penicillium verhagenii TaxID=1562060 RepID=UPI0025457A1E|nr:WD40 repeat-like protein [Penicillium verhagenii]KAJ5947156.1 WD40 repeat-like protein [Penicillium verhagenii]
MSDDISVDVLKLPVDMKSSEETSLSDSIAIPSHTFEGDFDLWDMAYSQLRVEQVELITNYESILCEYLPGILNEKEKEDASLQQSRLVEFLGRSLENVQSMQPSMARNIAPYSKQALSAIVSLKSGIEAVVPHGTILWVALAIALQLLSTLASAVEDTVNAITGVIDITGKIKWYTGLADVLAHHQHRQEQSFMAMRCDILKSILKLYQKLLHFTIECVFAFRRGLTQALTNFEVFPSKWKDLRHGISITEGQVQQFLAQYCNTSVTSYVGLLVNLKMSREHRGIMQQLCVIDVDAAIESLRTPGDLKEDYFDELQKLASRECYERSLCIPKGDGEVTSSRMINFFDLAIENLNARFDISHVAYFFCNDTEPKADVTILRTLIWTLVRQDHILIQYLKNKHDNLGQRLFDDTNAFHTLKHILREMLADARIRLVILVTDRLDCCIQEKNKDYRLRKLLSDICQNNEKARWVRPGFSSVTHGGNCNSHFYD